MAAHNELGKWGEETATQLLRDKGYTIVDRDWRSGHRDIDIIARTPDGATLVFVEVKTRTKDDVTRPTDAVDMKKIKKHCSCRQPLCKEKQYRRLASLRCGVHRGQPRKA